MSICWISYTVLIISALFSSVESCVGNGGGGRKGNRGNNNNNNVGSNNAVSRLLGKNVNVSPYSDNGFDSKGGVANSPADLSCNFESSCCWKNVQPPADTMEWVKANGAVDSSALQKNFATSTQPTGSYLLLASDRATAATDNGRFKSCSLCSQTPINVKLNHWVTQGVRLQVCSQETDSGPLLNCQDVDNNGQPGPTSITLPPSTSTSPTNIVIVGTNFVASQGSVAMIDDITVDYQPCGSGVSSTLPSPPPITNQPPPIGGGVCQAVVCNFEAGNPCSYTDAQNVGGGPSQSFQVQKGPFQNPLTGIRKASDGNYYTAVYLKPQESAALKTAANFDQDRVIRFDSYRATDDVYLKGCCDKPDSCPYDSHKSVQVSDFQRWKSVSFACPKGTQNVLFMTKNEGRNQGAVGLDNINLLIPSGGGAETAQQTAC